MQSIVLNRVGLEPAHDAKETDRLAGVYSLSVDGKPVGYRLTMGGVIRKLRELDEAPDLSPATFQTPEDRRPAIKRRTE